MSILMRLLPLIINEKYNNPIDKKIKVFKTRDSVSEFMDTALRNTFNDMNVAYQKSFNPRQAQLFTEKLNLGYSSYVRDEDDLKEMKKSLENQPKVPRKRFDYVIGNPPYISYNECCKQEVLIFDLMKRGKAQLNDIYGFNLHSIPDRQKKYAPKPNLYSFFIALGMSLLKECGKLCYIIPQNILTAGDLDVLRYHLSRYTTIEKIITFSGKMFLGRGIKQNNPIATSSLVIVISKKSPDNLNSVELINYSGSDNLEMILSNVSLSKKVKRSRILQSKLFYYSKNWNFIKHDSKTLDFLEEYRRVSDDFSGHYDHVLAVRNYGCKFYIDGGAIIDDKRILEGNTNDAWVVYDYRVNNYKAYKLTVSSTKYYPKNASLRFPQGSQGVDVFRQKYKIVWRIKDTPIFQYTDKDILLVSNQSLLLSTNNRYEALYLTTILNHPITQKVLKVNLYQENERSLFVPITAIKEYFRIPRVTGENKHIKDDIIKLTERFLDFENHILSDHVNFSGILKQKYDRAFVDGGFLVLEKDREAIRLPINNDALLVSKVIGDKYTREELKIDKQVITLSELMAQPVIDFDKQREVKSLIDDLVFCLYFGIPVPEDRLADALFIRKLCEQNKYYSLVAKQ